jgi:transcriptional regulator with XRE-family HTH domain
MSKNHPLRQWRIKNKIILSELAKMAGTTASSISRVERGIQDPSLALMVRIVQATNKEITLHHFFLDWAENDSAA